MKRLESHIALGMHLKTAALLLIENAPACMMFNGILIRAKHKTTRSSDIVKQWERTRLIENIVYQHSVRGIKARADRAADIARSQGTVDACVSALDTLDFTNASDVLAWVESIAIAADDVAIVLDKDRIRGVFIHHGWEPGANVGPFFNAEDARNVAGYIVGQWLESGHPIVTMFAKDWRAKFMPLTNDAPSRAFGIMYHPPLEDHTIVDEAA